MNGTVGLAPAVISASTLGRSPAIQVIGLAVNYGSIAGAGGIYDGAKTVVATTVPTVHNQGSIAAVYIGVDLAAPQDAHDPAGVLINSATSMEPGGQVTAGYTGVVAGADGAYMGYLTATASNLGTIKGVGLNGRYGYGVQLLFANGTLANGSPDYRSATIYGRQQGVSINHGSATTTNFGTIVGGIGFSSYGGTYDNTLINYGSIAGTLGNAIDFGAGDNLLVLHPQATVAGTVLAGAGASTLELSAGATSGTLTGLGAALPDFAAVVIDAGANWYLDGRNFDARGPGYASVTNDGSLNVLAQQALALGGSIASSVTLHAGSTLTNVSGGTLSQTRAAVAVLADAAASLVNHGLIAASETGGIGVTLLAAGAITNGANYPGSATIYGYTNAVDLHGTASTLTNYATLTARAVAPHAGTAVAMGSGDVLLNGTGGSGTASIGGGVGVNDAGGTIINGAGTYAAATIYGSGVAVALSDAGTLVNVAHVQGSTTAGFGVFLTTGGTLVNQSASGGGVIGGYYAVFANTGSIDNEGSIRSTGSIASGVVLQGAGTIVNGLASKTAAAIRGPAYGIALSHGTAPSDTAVVRNYGVVSTPGSDGIDVSQVLATIGNGALSIAGNPGPVSRRADRRRRARHLRPPVHPAGQRGTGAGGGERRHHHRRDRGRRRQPHQPDQCRHHRRQRRHRGRADRHRRRGGGVSRRQIRRPGEGRPDRPAGTGGKRAGHVQRRRRRRHQFRHAAGRCRRGLGFFRRGHHRRRREAGERRHHPGERRRQFDCPDVALFAGRPGDRRAGVRQRHYLDLRQRGAEQTITFAGPPGGELQIANPGAFAGTIDGFVPGTTIDLPGITATSAGVTAGVLTVRAGGGVAAALSVTGSFIHQQITHGPDGNGGTVLGVINAPACFAVGTRVLTAAGEVPVERLRVGDLVPVRDALLPIVWIGHRRVRHQRPVRIATHAFAPGRPHASLLLSPDHAVLVEAALIPVRRLVATAPPSRSSGSTRLLTITSNCRATRCCWPRGCGARVFSIPATARRSTRWHGKCCANDQPWNASPSSNSRPPPPPPPPAPSPCRRLSRRPASTSC